MSSPPLVVIGIPTYRRSGLLRRAIESALAQTYRHIRVEVCDNASPDDTEAVCLRYVHEDARLRYYRQPHNVGPTANFRAVLQRADGPYYMWLADDDWLPPDFIERCVEALEADPRLILAGARARYTGRTGEPTGIALNCLAVSAFLRMLDYYRQVDDNSIFYGVIRSECAKRVDVHNWIGADWLYVAALAYQGRIRTLHGLSIHREPAGASQSLRHMAAALGLPAWQGRVPVTVSLMVNAAADLFCNRAYAGAALWWKLPLAMLLPVWILLWKPAQEIARRLQGRQGV